MTNINRTGTPNRPGGGFQGGSERQQHGGGQRNDGPEFNQQIKNTIEGIIKNGFTKAAMDLVEQIGRDIKEVTSSQIRIAYGEVTRLKMKSEIPISEVLMLKPKLAYAAGRAQKNKNLYVFLKNVISYAVDVTADPNCTKEEQNKRFKNLAAMFEAILAYHKAAGGN